MRTYLVCVGGLGNQLFIWNAAHHLVEQGQKVTILTPKKSTRDLELPDLRNFCTHKIGLRESKLVFKILQVIDFSIWKIPTVRHLYSRIGLICYGRADDRIRSSSKRALLHWGYFQNVDMVETQKLVVIPEILELCQVRINDLRNRVKMPEEYEAFHIRRGDLCQNQEGIGVLSDEFYMNQRGASELVLSTENSSDLTREFNATFISTKENCSNWESFSVLCYSKRLVTANSTFSWWAGMVAKYRDPKCQVIQPNRYYKNSEDQDFLMVDNFTQARALFL